MLPAPLYIIASPRPRTGKTLIARLMIEFFRAGGRPLVGYDLNPREQALATRFPKPGLARGYHRYTRPDGAVRPADRRHRKHEVVDLGYGSVRSVLCGHGGDRLPPGSAAADDRADCAVHQRSCGGDGPQLCRLRKPAEQRLSCRCTTKSVSLMFAKQDFPATRPECGLIRIPRLSPIVRGVIDRPNFSFAAYWASSPAGRPRSINGSARSLRNFANSNCGC